MTSSRGGRSSHCWAAGLAAIAVFAGGLRLWVAEEVAPVQLLGDEFYYVDTAANIAQGEGHYSSRFKAWAAWPPGNAWWLSHFIRSADRTARVAPPAAVRAQVVLGTLICLLSAVLGRLLFDARTGLVTGCIAALYPGLVAFSHYLWATTLFTTLLLMGLVGVLLADRCRRDLLIVAASGLIFGLAALTRESTFAVAGGISLWWLWRAEPGTRGRALMRSAALLVPAVLVVLPWTLRNYERLDQFMLVSNAGWLALGQGNSLRHPNWLEPDTAAQMAFNRSYQATPERDRAAFGRERVAQLVRSEQPTWIFKKAVLNLSLLFRPDSFIFWKMSHQSYKRIDPELSRTIMVGTMTAYLLVMVLGILGCVVAESGRRSSFFACVSVPLIALHVIAFASARYRIPLMPLFIAYAAHWCVGGRESLRQLRGRRALAAALLLLFLFAVCVPHFLADGARMWATGSYFG